MRHSLLNGSGQTFLVALINLGHAVLDESAAFAEQVLLDLFGRRTMQADPVAEPANPDKIGDGGEQRPGSDIVERKLGIALRRKAKGFHQHDRRLLRHHPSDRHEPLARRRIPLRAQIGHIDPARIDMDLLRRQAKRDQALAMMFAAREDRPGAGIDLILLGHARQQQTGADIDAMRLNHIGQPHPIQQRHKVHEHIHVFAQHDRNLVLAKKPRDRLLEHRPPALAQPGTKADANA